MSFKIESIKGSEGVIEEERDEVYILKIRRKKYLHAIVWIDKLCDCDEFVSLTNGAMRTCKTHFFSYDRNCC